MRSAWPLALICLAACEAPSTITSSAYAQTPGRLEALTRRPEAARPFARRRQMTPQQIAAQVKTHPGALPSLTPKGAAEALPLKRTRVWAEIVGDVASVEVHQGRGVDVVMLRYTGFSHYSHG